MVHRQGLLLVLDAHRSQDVQETLNDQELPINLSRPILCPKREVVGHVISIKSLEGGIIPAQSVVGIDLFEAFFIIMVRIPQGIVQVDEQVLIRHYPTSITKYLPKLQNAFSSLIFKVRLRSSSSTNSYEPSGWLLFSFALLAKSGISFTSRMSMLMK